MVPVMKTITLKTDLEFFNYLDRLSKNLKKPKSQIIKEAILEYGKKLEREEIYKKMEKLSKELSEDKQYLKEIKEFEALSGDLIE